MGKFTPQQLRDIFLKLNGPITPIGDSSVDHDRFDNLKRLCDLVNMLITDIDDLHIFLDSKEFTVKRAAEYSTNFLTNTIGIK